VTGLTCKLDPSPSSLPGRTAALVERDRRRYGLEVERVAGKDPLVHIDPTGPSTLTLTADRLLTVLAGAATDDRLAAAAAFVAGRCTTGDSNADRAIHEALDTALGTVDVSKPLGSSAALFVEAVMSLALLGEVDRATQLFTAQLTHPTHRSMEDSLMAGYLAQLGGVEGYPIILEELRDPDSGQLRRNAVDQVIAFLPYDGQSVGGITIDVLAELEKATHDESPYVQQRVEAVRAELGLTESPGAGD
jgi:hypothetical protein